MNAHATISVMLLSEFVYAEPLLHFEGWFEILFLAWMFFNTHNKGVATKLAENMDREDPAG